MKYTFYIEQRTDINYYKEMKNWLDISCSKDWKWIESKDSIVFYNEEDAIAFKLKYHSYDAK